MRYQWSVGIERHTFLGPFLFYILLLNMLPIFRIETHLNWFVAKLGCDKKYWCFDFFCLGHELILSKIFLVGNAHSLFDQFLLPYKHN